MPTDLQLADDLERAADYLVDSGWVQGVAKNAEGKVCLTGAIDYGSLTYPNLARHAVDEYFNIYWPNGYPEPVSFNDASGRREGQVVNVINQVAAWLRNGRLK